MAAEESERERMGLALHRGPKAERRVIFGAVADRKAMELVTAKEILQEVFGASRSEVEEMIRLRLELQAAI